MSQVIGKALTLRGTRSRFAVGLMPNISFKADGFAAA